MVHFVLFIYTQHSFEMQVISHNI